MAPIPNKKRNVASSGEMWAFLPVRQREEGYHCSTHSPPAAQEDSGILKGALRNLTQSFLISCIFHPSSRLAAVGSVLGFPSPWNLIRVHPRSRSSPSSFFQPGPWGVTPLLFPQTKEGLGVFERSKQTPELHKEPRQAMLQIKLKEAQLLHHYLISPSLIPCL